MKSGQFLSSAATVTWGVGLTTAGTVAMVLGRLTAIEQRDYAEPSTAAQAAMVIGGVAALVGVFVLLVGVYQLATNVDLAAKVASDVLTREQTARADADRDEREREVAKGAEHPDR